MSVRAPARDVYRRNNVTVTGNPAGRPVMFAHGFGCSQEMWQAVTPALEADYAVVLFDHVGSGESDLTAYDRSKYDSLHGYADDVLEIMEDLDLRDVVFVGHSVSAIIGVLANTTDPSRFGALILVGPSPRYLNDAGYTGGFDQKDIDGMLDSLDSNYLDWSAAMGPLIMGNEGRPELAEKFIKSLCRNDPDIARHFARVTFLSDNRRDLARVVTPTLVLQCSEDFIAPLSVGDFVHRAIPGSLMVVLAATGHCPNLSAPEELSTEILSFLR